MYVHSTGFEASPFRLIALSGKLDGGAAERLVVEDSKQKQRIISSIHDSSHLGVNRTNDMVAMKYYWPGLSTDVHAYVSTKHPASVYNKCVSI